MNKKNLKKMLTDKETHYIVKMKRFTKRNIVGGFIYEK